MIQQMVADNEIDIASTRALLSRACWELDQGGRAVDRRRRSRRPMLRRRSSASWIEAIQMCGGMGVSDDLPLARLPREVRPFRIYDGPSEVHRWAIAKRASAGRRRPLRPGGLMTQLPGMDVDRFATFLVDGGVAVPASCGSS